MAVLKVNPTRMELRNLERRKVIAVRGHRLLKEKQDSLIRTFMRLSEEARTLRNQVEHHFDQIQSAYLMASLRSDEDQIQRSLMRRRSKLSVKIGLDSILSVSVPRYQLEPFTQRKDDTSLFVIGKEMDQNQTLYQELVPELIELAQIEKRCLVLAHEISSTRRRVNALEHRTIPDLEETIRMIEMKIEEQERSQRARLTKISEKAN